MMSLLSLAPAPKQLLISLGHPFSLHHSHTATALKMAEVEVIGYKVERNTVPLAQIEALVVQIERGLEVSIVRDKWTEFKSPVEAIAVRNEFMKVMCVLNRLSGETWPFTPPTPCSIYSPALHERRYETN